MHKEFNKELKIASISGMLFLQVLILVNIFDPYLMEFPKGYEIALTLVYIFINLALLSLFIIFIWGFKTFGQQYQNNLLKIGSCILIVAAIIFLGVEEIIDDGLATLFPIFRFIPTGIPIHLADETIIIGADSISTIIGSLALILFGIGLLKLKIELGLIASLTGITTIFFGISEGLQVIIMTIYSEIFGSLTDYLRNLLVIFIYLLPLSSIILWIIILFKVSKKLEVA